MPRMPSASRYVPPPRRAVALAPDSTVARPNAEDLLKRCESAAAPIVRPDPTDRPPVARSRRVSIVAFQHICKGERVDPSLSEGLSVRSARSASHLARIRAQGRFPPGARPPVTLSAAPPADGVELSEEELKFAEHNFVTSQWRYRFSRVPRMGFLTGFLVKVCAGRAYRQRIHASTSASHVHASARRRSLRRTESLACPRSSTSSAPSSWRPG